MDKCTVFTGGEIIDLTFIDAKAVSETFVVCADSGYVYANKLGITPDVVIGDYDSLGFIPDTDSEIFTFPAEKDDTDLMLAIKEAMKRGYKDFDIYGALGGRFDHTFSNIQALAYISVHGGVGRIISEHEEIVLLVPGSYTFAKKDGYSLSLFSYTDVVEELDISGVKYSARTDLVNSFPLGISNVIIDEHAKISFTGGRLLVVQSEIINQSFKNE